MCREEKGVYGGVKKLLCRCPKRKELLSCGYRDYGKYWAQRARVKLAIKVAKKIADWRWGERFGNDFEGLERGK